MRSALTPPRLGGARAPLTRLVREGWIWRGRQPLDAVYVPRSGGVRGDARRVAAMFLDDAQHVLADADGFLLLFETPRECDCDALGPVTPLRRRHGALSSFPFAAPRTPDIADAIAGRALFIRGGVLEGRPLSGFRPVDLTDWVSVAGLRVAPGETPPLRAGAEVAALSIEADAPELPADIDAGLAAVRAAIDRAPAGGEGPVPTRLGIAAAIAVLFFVLVAVLASPGGEDPESATGAIFVGAAGAFAVAYALFAWLGRAARPSGGGHGAEQTSAEQTSAEQTSAQPTSARPKPPRPVGSAASSVWRGGAALIVLSALGGAAFLFAGKGLAPVLVGIAGVAAIYLVSWALGRAVGAGGGRGAAPPAHEGPSPAPPARPPQRAWGRLGRWLNRLLQGTPLTDHALGKYRRRVEDLERLFAEGRTDEALKKALALASRSEDEQGVRADEPISGPGVRERLNIAVARGRGGPPLAALPRGARERLETLYRTEAERLAAAGQTERAAFIYAELLDEAEAAVRIFADAGLLETAARLAWGRGLAPALFIALWARAGALDRALVLAERHGAYDVLMNAAETENAAFQDEIRRRWSRRLAAVGALEAALAVSEPLAAIDPEIAAERLRWMADGIARPDADAETLARAAMAMPPSVGETRADPPMAAIDALLAAEGAAAATRRKRLAEALLRTEREPVRDSAYAAERAPRIADRLARRLLADAAAYPGGAALGLVRALAEAGGQSSLAADIRAVPARGVRNAPAPTAPRHVSLGPILGATAVVAATPLAGARALVGYEDGRLEIIGPGARTLWADRVWRVRDVIPVVPGRRALVLREEPSGLALSVLDADRMRLVDVGSVALTHWAPHASVAGWLVYDGAAVLDLAIGPLLAALDGDAPSALERKWATPITIEGVMVALTRTSDEAAWLFQRADGVLERWSVDAQTLRVAYREVGLDLGGSAATSSDLLSFDQIGRSDRLETRRFGAPPQAAEARRGARRDHRRPPPPALIQTAWRRPKVGALSPLRVAPSSRMTPPSGLCFGVVRPGRVATLLVSAPDARTATCRDLDGEAIAAIHDDLGRFVLISLETGETLHANVALDQSV